MLRMNNYFLLHIHFFLLISFKKTLVLIFAVTSLLLFFSCNDGYLAAVSITVYI